MYLKNKSDDYEDGGFDERGTCWKAGCMKLVPEGG